jgi:glycosyltransferase involved in cell wall biosynthesis
VAIAPDVPVVSAIVPAWNEEAALPATLERLNAALASAGRPYELIVVDDASTDRTPEIARSAGARVERVEKRQIAAVRNAGAAIARGRFLVFVDADTLLPDDTLRAALEALDRGAVGGGALVGMEGPVPLLLRPCLWAFMAVWRWLGYAAGCFVFCVRADFRAVGGFDERYFASEEVWLSKALQARGPFRIVGPPVVTSGRKLRTRRPLELLLYSIRLLLKGPQGCQRREGLELWYDGRRE